MKWSFPFLFVLGIILTLCVFTLCVFNEEGIDVGELHGKIDWQKVKDEKITFAVTHATSGTSSVSDRFEEHLRGMKRHNIKGAVYHYFREREPAIPQCNFMRSILSESSVFDNSIHKLAIVMDRQGNSNVNREQFSRHFKMFMDCILNYNFYNIIIYTEKDFWEDYIYEEFHSYYSQFPLWLKHFGDRSTLVAPSPWKEKGGEIWWQYGERAIDGIKKTVHVNRKIWLGDPTSVTTSQHQSQSVPASTTTYSYELGCEVLKRY